MADATAIVRWDAPGYIDHIMDEFERRMGIAVEFIRGEMIEKLNRTQPLASGKGGRRRGLDPSKPGEPPKRVESRLIQDISTKVIRKRRSITGIDGTNVEYARRHELGFHGVDSRGRNVSHDKRPFMRPSVVENREPLRKILVGT